MEKAKDSKGKPGSKVIIAKKRKKRKKVKKKVKKAKKVKKKESKDYTKSSAQQGIVHCGKSEAVLFRFLQEE